MKRKVYSCLLVVLCATGLLAAGCDSLKGSDGTKGPMGAQGPAAEITPGSIQTESLANGSVGTDQLAANAVATNNIQNDAVTSAKIKDGDVQTADLGTSSVTSDKIVSVDTTQVRLLTGPMLDFSLYSAYGDLFNEAMVYDGTASTSASPGSILTMQASDLIYINDAPGTVSNSNIQDGAVTDAKLAGGINGAKIADLTITDSKIASGISGGKLNPLSVTDAQLAGGINGNKLGVGTVTDDKIVSLDAGKLTGTLPPAAFNAYSNLSTDLRLQPPPVGPLTNIVTYANGDARYAPLVHTHSGGDITSGAIGNAYFSAYSDLTAEGYLDNSAPGDLLRQSDGDGRYSTLGHTHPFTEVTGTIDPNTQITANTIPGDRIISLDGGKITTGTVAAARIDSTMATDTELADGLTLKSNKGHTHDGSSINDHTITSLQLKNTTGSEAVAFENIQANAITNWWNAPGTGNVNTSSNAYADLTDMSITPTGCRGGLYLITFNGVFDAQAVANALWLSLQVNGAEVAVAKTTTIASGQSASAAITWIEPITAGTCAAAVIKVQWKVESNGNTIRNQTGGANYGRNLRIMELAR